MYQTLMAVFFHIAKHLEFHQIYSTVDALYSFPSVCKCGEIKSFMFDILLLELINNSMNVVPRSTMNTNGGTENYL